MEIRNLEHTDFDTLFDCFEQAFADYAVHFGKEELRSMLTRRGFCPRLSFAAFDNDLPVAFTINGIGPCDGILSAYDIATGAIKEYRGQGVAGELFAHALPLLKEAGVGQYVLEVLQDNSKALAVYRRMNFTVSREFDCFRQSIALIAGERGSAECEVKAIDIASVRHAFGFCDFSPSWQNSLDSIERGWSGLIALGAYIAGALAGCCVLDPLTGDLAMLVVSAEYRRRGIATRLLSEALGRMKTDSIKVLNVASDYAPMHDFLATRNIPLASRQFEMCYLLNN
ncbi:MAG: GNAT family N-acetyltransferase [Muribaculaceae bacterium]|nr:GNAT family N-acetyltransferase [Muribaculaceae bacterium]